MRCSRGGRLSETGHLPYEPTPEICHPLLEWKSVDENEQRGGGQLSSENLSAYKMNFCPFFTEI
jgi:hypothetical protein